MMLLYAFLPENERQGFFMRARERAEAAEKERLQKTVGQWARDVEASMKFKLVETRSPNSVCCGCSLWNLCCQLLPVSASDVMHSLNMWIWK